MCDVTGEPGSADEQNALAAAIRSEASTLYKSWLATSERVRDWQQKIATTTKVGIAVLAVFFIFKVATCLRSTAGAVMPLGSSVKTSSNVGMMAVIVPNFVVLHETVLTADKKTNL